MHKAHGVAFLFVTGLILAGCGTHSPNNLNGTWVATLTNSDGTTASSFRAGIKQTGNGSLTFPGFAFRSVGFCNQLTLAGASGAAVGQSVVITISSGFGQPESLTLTLNGTGNLNGSTVSGAWAIIGGIAPCNGTGTFTMTRAVAGG